MSVREPRTGIPHYAWRLLAVWVLCSPAGCCVPDHPSALSPALLAEVPPAAQVAEPTPSTGPEQPADRVPDPARATDAVLSLDQVINACLQSDPQIRAEWEAVNQAQADLVTSALLPNPTLWSDFQLLPLTRPFTIDRQGGPPQMDAQITMPIDWFLFGKRAAALVSARLGVDSAAADFADAVRQRIAATTAAYYEVLQAEALLRLARANLESLRQLEEITRKHVQAGKAEAGDLSEARTALLEGRREAREQEKNHAVALARLHALVGHCTAAPSFRVTGVLGVSHVVEPPSLEQALQLALETRPDLESLRQQIARAEADIRVEKTQAYPAVKPTIGYSRQFQQKVIGFPDANSYTFALETDIPLFSRNQGEIRKAQSVLAQKHLDLQARLVTLRAELVEALEELATAAVDVTTIGPEQVMLAERERDQRLEAYKVGAQPLHDTLEAHRDYYAAARHLVTSQADYWKSLHQINAVIGKVVLRPTLPTGDCPPARQ